MATVRKRSWKLGDTTKTAWLVDYQDRQGKRRFKTFKRKKDADAYLDKVKAELHLGTHTPDSESITVEQIAELWLQSCRTGDADRAPLERSTINEYEAHLRMYICDPDMGVGHVKLSRLEYADVTALYSRMADIGRSQAMRFRVRQTLSALLSFAVEQGKVSRHVIRDVSRRRKRRQSREKHEIVIPTKDELRRMIEAARGRFRPFLLTAVFAGLRASELRGLPWRHVDLTDAILRVRQRADRWNVIGPPKSQAANRDIPLAPIVANALREWRLQCPRSSLDLVFPTSRGTVQSATNTRRRELAPLQMTLGIVNGHGRAKYGLHALRHAAASLFID